MSFGADSELGNQTQVSRQTLTLYVKGIANETPCTCPITSNGRWKELHCGHSVTVLYALPLSEWIRTNFSESEEETSNANVELVICSLILCWTIEVVLLFVAEAHLQLALSKGAIHILHKLNAKAKSNYRGYNRKSSSQKNFPFIFPLIILLQTSVCML